MSPERVSVGDKEEGPCRWTENRKGSGTNSGESGARNLEAESIRSRAEKYERVCKAEDSHRDKKEQCP